MTRTSQRTVATAPWKSILLDSVAKRGSGHTPDKKHPEYWKGTIKWLSLKDLDRLDNLYIFDTAERITPAGIVNSSAVEHRAGSVVLSRDASVGRSAITQDVMAVSQHFIAWQCGSCLNNHFLYYWLQYKKPEFERIAIGNTIKTIGLPYFRALEIPLPILDEQRMIAAVLADMDGLLGALDRLIAKKRDLRQATMQQLLTGRTRLPGFSGKWERVPMGELFTFKNGLNKAKDFFGTGTPIVNYMDVYRSTGLRVASLGGRVSVSAQEQKTFDVRKGDVFFTRTSETVEEIGLAAVMLDDCRDTVFSGFLLRARPKDESLCDSFKKYCLRSQAIRLQIISRASYTTRALTNGRLLSAILLDRPPRLEQAAIGSVLSDMDAELIALEQRRDKTRLLKQGMMQELLTQGTRLL